MIAKLWKKIGLLILIIACIYNVLNKIVKKVSFDNEMESTATYYNENIKDKNSVENKQTEIDTEKFKEMNNYNNLFENKTY